MIQNNLTNDRGQVGIGTLIVFIALVLVAAIAAGVLINTAGFLQTQAEETGQDSTDQVADNINVIGEVGEVLQAEEDSDDVNRIYEARLTVQRSPGSDDIDLTGLSIQYVGDNGFAQLVHASDADEPADISDTDTSGGAGSEPVDEEVVNDPEDALDDDSEQIRGEAAYLVEEITADSDGDAVMTDDGDRYEIVIPLGIMLDQNADAGGDAIVLADEDLDEGDTVGDEPSLAEIQTSLENTDVVEEGEVGFDNGDLNTLKEGDAAELEITTDAGATRNVAISAPDTLIDEEGGTVTL